MFANKEYLKKLALALYFCTLITGCVQSSGTPEKLPDDAGVQRYGSRNTIPESIIPEPNLATMQHYVRQKIRNRNAHSKLLSMRSREPRYLRSELRENAYLSSQMSSTGLISYIYYSDGKIIYDKLSDETRFGKYIKNYTPLWSHSIGKSLTSYLLAHSICNGDIESINSKLDDWPLISGTLYENRKISDLINMRAGDQLVVTEVDGMVETGRWFYEHPISSYTQNELMQTKPADRTKYNYSGLPPYIILNYVIFKSGYQANDLMNAVFKDKVNIGQPIFFEVKRGAPLANGPVLPEAHATRYDFLRIAVAMLDDWNNGTCVGNYLKQILKLSRQTDVKHPKGFRLNYSNKYGGFFHTNYQGMRSRNILGMDGYSGQSVLIDFDNGHIVVANAIHNNYDWKTLVLDTVKYGDIPRK